MIAEIISIGDELLIGQVVNTNAAWLAQQLNNIGIRVIRISVISDNSQQIINALDDAKNRADIIISTGGIGPTKDDITKNTLCEYFNTKLVFSNDAFKDIESLFHKKGYKITESNKRQAYLPENAKHIKNYHGTARGMIFEKDKKIFIALPGVPFEMKAMTSDYIIPWLYDDKQFIYHKTILTQGIGESFLSELISDWEKNLPSPISLAYLPSPGIVRLRLSAYALKNDTAFNFVDLKNKVDSQIENLKKIIPDFIFGYDDDSLENIIGELLKKNLLTLATAESCTGGYISHKITSIPGSSQYFTGSVVAYSNNIKTDILNVNPNTIVKYGAVSQQTAIEMAFGVKKLFNSDFAIAVTGIAGPEGGSSDKPVGTTWIAIASPSYSTADNFLFGDNRDRNIIKAAISALNMLRKVLLKL